MNLLSNKKQTTIEKLEQQSQKAIGVFQETINSLSLVNSDIAKEKEVLTSEIAERKAKVVSLNSLSKTNQQFVDKINEFLGL